MPSTTFAVKAPAAGLPRGGFRSHKQDTYRTRDGRALFEFQFVPKGDHIEIDILQQPDYGRRKSDLHNTHRLPSDRGGHRICMGNPQAASDLTRARQWAAMWAEHTWKYINTGIPFPNDNPVAAVRRLFGPLENISDWAIWERLGGALFWGVVIYGLSRLLF